MFDFKLKLISLAQMITSFFSLNRPAVVYMGLPFAMVGVAYALIATWSSITLIQGVLGLSAVFLVTGGSHTFDDYFDRKRDRGLWPMRALTMGFATPRQALTFAVVSNITGYILALIAFNFVCFFILILASILTILYSGFFRDRIGYLTLPLLIGLFPLGGVSALAPDLLFNDYIPWLLFIMVSLWQAGHILAYSPPHGIDVDGKTKIPALIIRLSPPTTLFLSGIMIAALAILSIIFYFLVNMSDFYLIMAIIMGSFTTMTVFRVSIKKNCTIENCMKATLTVSSYGAGLFLFITLELLNRYSHDYFLILLIVCIVMFILSIPSFIGTGMPYLENNFI
ncbi:MAG: UbiA family prenyltransferase [Candidatus Helarchaeota archaeon]